MGICVQKKRRGKKSKNAVFYQRPQIYFYYFCYWVGKTLRWKTFQRDPMKSKLLGSYLKILYLFNLVFARFLFPLVHCISTTVVKVTSIQKITIKQQDLTSKVIPLTQIKANISILNADVRWVLGLRRQLILKICSVTWEIPPEKNIFKISLKNYMHRSFLWSLLVLIFSHDHHGSGDNSQ